MAYVEQTEDTLYDLIIENLKRHSNTHFSLLHEDNTKRDNFKKIIK